jgi:hypothetical protein
VAAPDADLGVLRVTLIEAMRMALPAALRPRSVTVMASLPTLSGGKIDLVALTEGRRSSREH